MMDLQKSFRFLKIHQYFFIILTIITFVICAFLGTLTNCELFHSPFKNDLKDDLIKGGAQHPLDQRRERAKHYQHELTDSANQSNGYDEYADPDLLIEHDANYLNNVKNIVIDGNNFLYYLMGSDNNYEKYLIEALDYCSKNFKQNVFFVIKDLKIDFNLKDYAIDNLRIVVAQGEAKARDDYLVLHIAESLPGKTIILTRDRYRDIHNITASEPVSYTVYGKAHVKYNKMFDTNGNFATVGRWTVAAGLMGYASIPDKALGVWTRKQRNKATSTTVLNLQKK